MSIHKMIMLWAHPRSMSTATERIMRARGDCCCLHEPFMYYYYLHRKAGHMPFFDSEVDRPSRFEDIVNLIQQSAQKQTVFSKDMAYYVLPELYCHPQLVAAMEHIFLIRDPRKSIVSYHKLDPELSQQEIGYESQWQLYQWIVSNTSKVPMVVEAEAIQHHPEQVIGHVWESLGLPFIADAFNWDEKERPADWQQVETWHQKTLSKSRIEADQASETEVQTLFDQAAAQSPRLQRYLDHHQPFYEQLKRVARHQAD